MVSQDEARLCLGARVQLSTTDNTHAHTIRIHSTTNSITGNSNSTSNFTDNGNSTSNVTINANSTNNSNHRPRTDHTHFTHDAYVS